VDFHFVQGRIPVQKYYFCPKQKDFRMMKIFKFGGGILADAAAVRHLPEVLGLYPGTDLVIVISAFGKTTNALEKFIAAKFERREEEARAFKLEIGDFHFRLLQELWEDRASPIYREVQRLLQQLDVTSEMTMKVSFDQYYDRVICFGELLSSTIIHQYLKNNGIENSWADARELIRTDSVFRNAAVDFEVSKVNIEKRLQPLIKTDFEAPVFIVTQGFIGADAEGRPTTLGREGSDYTASIFGNLLDTQEVIIWKDVPGVLNADPKHFSHTVKLDRLSYAEATELAYYGAKVMHPKTVKPLQNKQIPLWVKPYFEPAEEGTLIHTPTDHDTRIPSFIFKFHQVLISISTKDFSFINERVYHEVFGIVSRCSMHANITQNSALTLSFCVDYHRNLPALLEELMKRYTVRYNEGLELITIRHFAEDSKVKVLQGKEVILEQQNRSVLQVVVR
jgi:aspartate kinase